MSSAPRFRHPPVAQAFLNQILTVIDAHDPRAARSPDLEVDQEQIQRRPEHRVGAATLITEEWGG